MGSAGFDLRWSIAGPGVHDGKRPLSGRYDLSLTVGLHPDGQLGLRGVQAGGGIATDALIATQGLAVDARLIDADIDANAPPDRLFAVRGDGDVQHHAVVPGHEIPLPA